MGSLGTRRWNAILAKEICGAGGIRPEIKTALRSLDRVMKEDRELKDTVSSLGEVRENGSGSFAKFAA